MGAAGEQRGLLHEPKVRSLHRIEEELGQDYNLGEGRILVDSDTCWPRFPVWVSSNLAKTE